MEVIITEGRQQTVAVEIQPLHKQRQVCFNHIVHVTTTRNSLSHFLLNVCCCLANSLENWHNQKYSAHKCCERAVSVSHSGMMRLGENETTETLIRFWISKVLIVTSKPPVTTTCSTFHISRSNPGIATYTRKICTFWERWESLVYVFASLETSSTWHFCNHKHSIRERF